MNILGMDILGMDIVGMDILGVDIVGRNILNMDISGMDILCMNILGMNILSMDILGIRIRRNGKTLMRAVWISLLPFPYQSVRSRHQINISATFLFVLEVDPDQGKQWFNLINMKKWTSR